MAVKHLHETPEPLESLRSDLPGALCKVINRMTAKNPEDRYENAQAVLNDIRKIAKSLKTGESVDHLIDAGTQGSGPFPVKRPALVLPLLCLIVTLCSAGMGMLLKKSTPPRNPDALETSVPDEGTAKQQYLSAMFEVNNEDAFKAVIKYYQTDKVWTPMAHEQLALMYLGDSTRHDEARQQLDIMKKFERTDLKTDLKTKARIGEAYLYALNDDMTLARNLLFRNSEDIQKYISSGSSWKQREEDTRAMIGPTENKQ